MTLPYLSQVERENLDRCPDDVAQRDLDAYFQLSKDDLAFVARLRGDPNRLGVALQGCCLRYLGFFPDNLLQLASPIVCYVAEQLGVTPSALERYGERAPTFFEHQQKVMAHLRYRRATPIDLLDLEGWLLERALEHDKPKLLFALACDYLYRNRVVRPGVTRLAKLVGTARSRAEGTTFERLRPLLTDKNRALLEGLLSSEETGRTPLAWLQRTPTSNRAVAIVQTLDKLAFLHAHGVDSWDLSALNPNRLKRDGPHLGSAPLLMKLVRRLASDAALGLAADQSWRGHTSVA